MTRREALAALILLPAALTAVPPKPTWGEAWGEVLRLSKKAMVSVAEFERQMRQLEAKVARTGRKIATLQGPVDEISKAVIA